MCVLIWAWLLSFDVTSEKLMHIFMCRSGSLSCSAREAATVCTVGVPFYILSFVSICLLVSLLALRKSHYVAQAKLDSRSSCFCLLIIGITGTLRHAQPFPSFDRHQVVSTLVLVQRMLI